MNRKIIKLDHARTRRSQSARIPAIRRKRGHALSSSRTVMFGAILMLMITIWSMLNDNRSVDWQHPPMEAITVPTADVRVIDGDTFEVSGERLRLKGWDTPEIFGSEACSAEQQLGQRARNEAQRLLRRSKAFTYLPVGTDRYGRTLSHWALDGVDFGQTLGKAGFAKRWDIERQQKPDWCNG